MLHSWLLSFAELTKKVQKVIPVKFGRDARSSPHPFQFPHQSRACEKVPFFPGMRYGVLCLCCPLCCSSVHTCARPCILFVRVLKQFGVYFSSGCLGAGDLVGESSLLWSLSHGALLFMRSLLLVVGLLQLQVFCSSVSRTTLASLNWLLDLESGGERKKNRCLAS